MILDSEITTVGHDDPGFPISFGHSGFSATETLWLAGPAHILNGPKTGFFCSSECPGSVILKTFDAITALRDTDCTLIGGFHSPMEWECLGILLRGRQPVIWVPARGIVGMHLKPELRPAFAAGRLLILSPFGPKVKRITADLAQARNRLVASLANRVFVAHASPGSRTLALCAQISATGKEVFTVADPANANLLALTAKNVR